MRPITVILSPFPPVPLIPCASVAAPAPRPTSPILTVLKRLGPGPVARWEIVEELEPNLGGDRRDLRRRRAEVFKRIDDLVRRGQLVKVGRYQLLSPDSTAAAAAPSADNRYHRRRNAAPRRTGVSLPRKRGVRDGIAQHDSRARQQRTAEQVATPAKKISVSCLPAQTPQLELPKPNPTAEAIREAARSLGRRRGTRKRWSGFVNGERVWRGREIELPDGRRVYAFGALRGMVIWSLDPSCLPGGVDQPLGWGAIPQEKVRLVPCAAAQLLGSRKGGVRERPSPAKAAAVRINGRMPPRPGSRPRGRPRAEGSPSAYP
jgi:hypothetical protein